MMIAYDSSRALTVTKASDNRSILKMIANDAVVGIVSNIAFTPSSTATSATALVTAGFATVAQGLTLSTAVTSNKF